MFAVGRYDPRADGDAAGRRKNEERKKGPSSRQARDGDTPGRSRRKRHRRDAARQRGESGTNESAEASPPHGRPSRSLGNHDVATVHSDGENARDSVEPEIETIRLGEKGGAMDIDIGAPDDQGDREGKKSDSSRSVPLSSSDGSEDEAENEGPALKVIAPEQRFASVSGTRRRAGTTDEGLDDFDLDEDGQGVSEGRGDQRTPAQQRHDAEISTALRMSNLPIREAATVWDLAPFLVSNLVRDGYKHFFPIQSLVIPDVIASERHSQIRARDVCVSAPTGSGKTLAFVLPVLNALSNRNIRRLRALAVLPSRDLATQVFRVFERYAKGSCLRVGLAIGQTDFEAEQNSLILGSGGSGNDDDDDAFLRHAFNPTNPSFAVDAYSRKAEYAPVGHVQHHRTALDLLSTPLGGRSAVDVLVATPGRLMDHLDKTPGFTLQHLRFLVIDEADRLLNQSYQNWIGRVTAAASSASMLGPSNRERNQGVPLNLSRDGTAFAIDPITWRADMTDDRSSIVASVSQPVPLRKLLFSATLTKDPQKLASLGLVNPKHFDAHHLHVSKHGSPGSAQQDLRSSGHQQKYSVPEGLSEYRLECTAEQKPLVLLAILLQHLGRTDVSAEQDSSGMVVVFTSSVDSTHRLARLLQLLWGAAGYGPMASIAEFSSALNQKQRSRLLKRCVDSSDRTKKTGDQKPVSVVICSDGMSRGMDIPVVSAVVNYDVPRYAKTYVHRCGRTARAGKEGKAISLLKGGQVGEFIKMRRLIDDPGRVEVIGAKKDLVRDAIPVYQACVKSLRHVIEAEEEGELDIVTPLTSEWLPRGSGATSSKKREEVEELIEPSRA